MDRRIGPQTLAAACAADPAVPCHELHGAAEAYYRSLGDEDFIKGWPARNDRRLAAATMAQPEA